MDALDMDKRWVYMGDSTIPPCLKYVYWNVIQTVYPIEPKYYILLNEKYKNRQQNARAIYPIDKHNIKFISAIRLLSSPLSVLIAMGTLYLIN